MQSAERAVEQFDPERELQERWPHWRVIFTPLSCGEVWVDAERLVLLPTPDNEDDRRHSLAHMCAHLSLGHLGGGEVISAKDESDADWLARVWLDEKVI